MNLLNPWYLAGLGAIIVPILIHVLQRDRIRRIVFPATRFLLGASRKITRKQALRELILLILRATAMALLAFALCRPFFMKPGTDEAGADGLGAKAAVLVIDTSASMRIGTRFDEAKKQALEKLGTYRAKLDKVALVTFDKEVATAVPLTAEVNSVTAAIEALKPGYGAANLAGAIQFADRLLQADEVKNLTREITIFSDLQRSNWSQFHGDWKLANGVKLEVKALSLKAPENVAITKVAIPKTTVVSPRNESLSLQVVNFGKEVRSGTKVTLTVNGEKADEKLVNLNPGKTEVVRFLYKFEKPCDCTGTLTIDSADDFADDNTYYFNVRVLPRVQVLLVNGAANKVASKDDGHFVKSALSVPGTPFQVKEVPPTALSEAELKDQQAVVFTNVNTIPEAATAALKPFIENGGGVMLFPGDRVVPEEFNKSFATVAPCRLKQVSTKDEKSDGWTVGEIDFQHPIFTHFSVPESGDFSTAKFSKYYVITDSQAAKVIARYIDGRPALLEQSIGKGYSLLFTSSAGMKWNDLCLQGGVFVPFIHESLKYLAVHSEGITTIDVGDPLAFNAKAVDVTAPDGEKVSVQQGGAIPSAKTPGLHTVTIGDRSESLAVNVPRAESEPPALDAAELESAIASNPEGETKVIEGVKVWVTASSSVKERVESGQKIGWYLLIALVALLFGEHILANNTSRR